MKFSILVPAYKPQFLAECIESILAQTYQDWELILVNDASPYDIESIVSKYEDERIHYRKREQGFGAERLVENWNDCLKYATGDYVINMGDDDKLLPNCLADYDALLEKYPGRDIYHTRVEYIDEHSNVIEQQKSRPAELNVYEMILWRIEEGKICIGEYLYNTQALKQRGGFYYTPYAWGSDDISVYQGTERFGCVNTNNIGFQYRRSLHTISSQYDIMKERYEATFRWEQWYKDFIKHIPTTEKEQQQRKEVVTRFIQKIYILRCSYIDRDIEQKPLRNLYYWMKRIRTDKSAHIKKRTLIVFFLNSIFRKED